ncbi:DEAD/DEAH box helicase [Nocardia xishanensis]|uniref:DEAD/DEAH box helicase n=1 Tax=Nocardia xishanensis TaxID=238964 RepID=UPI0033D36CBF
MRPTLEAVGLKESLLQYLSTTYALTDEGARESLHEFLGDENSGMFRGPFLRLRTPFTAGQPGWEALLDWARDDGWTPYAHQVAAFARLTSKGGHTPEPTLITTGTGSGKTEAFLYPILDHCARERAADRHGVKVVLLYPMNALATDQAQRINDLIEGNPALRRLQAGLYIGDRAATTYSSVLTRRSEMWLSPPDILITNYKMLDLLLQRSYDKPLWAGADIRYVVVDEFHTYDGAQGTDVAMLLRRLAAAVGTPQPDRPLGDICPVATSATLASSTDPATLRNLLDVATQVFGTEFAEESAIGENRLTVDDFLPSHEWDPELPMPDPDQLADLPDPTSGDEALADLVEAVTGTRDTDEFLLGANLRRHVLTAAVMRALDGQVATTAEILDLMWRHGASSWARRIASRPEIAATALARFVALLSVARDPASTPDRERPLVQVEVHQWVRSVSRILRGVSPWPRAEFRWDSAGSASAPALHTRTAPATVATSGEPANIFLPAIYCRLCGRSGWAVFSPETDDQDVELDTHRIRKASVSPQDKIRIRNLIAATDAEAREGNDNAQSTVVTRSRRHTAQGASPGGALMVLDGQASRLRQPEPSRDFTPDKGEPRLTTGDSAFVLAILSDNANTAAREDWCPACGESNAIRFLGTGAAALAAASVTQLFTGGELDPARHEEKTLMFNASVQDAAHRAGFVASRSYTFSLRALLKKHLEENRPVALNDLIADVVAATTDPKTLRAVVPTDLYDLRGVNRLLSGTGRGGDLPTWRLVGERLAFDTLMEFGFRSQNGRTLELTRTAAAHVRIPDPAAAIELVKTVHADSMPQTDLLRPIDDSRYLAFLRIFLERLRTRGALKHKWLQGYLQESGTNRYQVWGGRPQGMRAFPTSVAAPKFLLSGPKQGTDFDVATGRLSWHEQWAGRCLHLPRECAPKFWASLLPKLAGLGLLSVGTPKDSTLRIYGLQPGHIEVQLLRDADINLAFVRCPVCFWERTVHPSLLDQWHGQPCPVYRCRTGRLSAGDRRDELDVHRRDRDYREDYYRQLYQRAGTYQIVTAEHTGLLTRPQRERIEQAFRQGTGFKDPNVLSCTPTLEMGIDIGDLSAVVLAALPRRPANYAQQVGRAGRRTGNAFLLTIPDRSRRDLYFLEQPREMIAGQIVPPGCHLGAVEILRRQYLAHLLDLAARERLLRADGVPLRPVPEHSTALFGPSGYLSDLVEAALPVGEQLARAFLALFPSDDINQARGQLLEYATRGLRSSIEEAERQWWRSEQMLQDRLAAVNTAFEELNESDPDHAVQMAELEAERRALGKRFTQRAMLTAQAAMCDLGLVPNYALIDSMTSLNATLYWSEGRNPKTGKERYTSKPYSYERPRRFALSELAPGNTFYANGYKHRITGIEIGAGDHRQWQYWRFCPDCGYVRTENAVDDRDPCPRCQGNRITDDGSCLFRVIEPTVVTARDRREDARIGDDKDDREQRYFTVIDAVDIPVQEIEPNLSWRHRTQTFGIDFCRTAMIRRINVGETRYDRHPQDDLAGHRVRLSPFYVCSGCGAATADGQPVFDLHVDGLNSSAARTPNLKHHQPWCQLRRGAKHDSVPQEKILLAHQLRTEALRILLPAATVLVEERIHSFRAALRLGVDIHFGGDPQHLDTTLASVPDRTGARRHYLVLFDQLPGGTGYLHRLTDPKAFRVTLEDARQALLACPCRDEGRRACHRCLYRYTNERFQDIVSRHEALHILEDLLGPVDESGEPLSDTWEIDSIATTDRVGLERQVESDLEARFLAVLREWAATDVNASLDEDGRASGYLRFTKESGVINWRLTAQRHMSYTRTDFTFERVDGPLQKVTIFLDGYRFHGTDEHNRLASDGRKRDQLRREGHVVFQVTWDDVELFDSESAKTEPVWPPYQVRECNTAKDTFQRLGRQPTHLVEAVFTNPIRTILAYLREPETTLWAHVAQACVSGLLAQDTRIMLEVGSSGVAETLRTVLAAYASGVGTPPSANARSGDVLVFRSSGLHGLCLLCVADSSRGRTAQDVRWTALSILDDGEDSVGTDEHRLQWRSWLYWSNLTQFLYQAGGDGVQLTTSNAREFPVETLAVAMHRAATPPVSEEPVPTPHRDRAWDDDILPLLLEDAPSSALAELARMLAEHGKRAPVYGYELGSEGWQVDFAWSGERKVAVVSDAPDDPDDEAERRNQAYRADGWDVRTATEWLDHIDTLIKLTPDVEGSSSR